MSFVDEYSRGKRCGGLVHGIALSANMIITGKMKFVGDVIQKGIFLVMVVDGYALGVITLIF